MTAGERGGHDYGYDDQSYDQYRAADWEQPTGSVGWGQGWQDYPTEARIPRYEGPCWSAADETAAYSGPDRADDETTSFWAVGQPTTDYSRPGYPDPRYSQSYPGPGYPDPAPPPVQPPADRTTGQPAAAAADRSAADRRNGLPLWQELPLLLIIAFCLAILIRTFLMQAFFIPSGSMEDTLVAGDRVLVNKLVYHFREPKRGEIVVFRGTNAWAPLDEVDDDIGIFARVGHTLGDLVGISRPGEKDYIKRIIGLPGDRVSCCDVEGRVYVNGQPLDEEYVIRDSQLDASSAGDCRGRRFDEVVVEPGQMFVLGDHRLVSQDSRCQGQVPVENIIGRAFVIVWPNDRWTSLSTPSTFDEVPLPTPPGWSDPSQPTHSSAALVLPLLAPIPWRFRAAAARSCRRRQRQVVGSRSD